MNQRNYGVDLLRLVLMFMVCILHTLGRGGILEASIIGTLSFKIFWLLEIFAYCAVDGFALISGYTSSGKQQYNKIIDMWLQVFFYSFIVTVVLSILGLNTDLSLKGFIKAALPVTSGEFWYFTAYFPLFFFKPIIDKWVLAAETANAQKMLVILVFLFSGLGIISDPFKTQGGYSALWLIVLYCIGALMKKSKLFEQKKTRELIVMWIVCISVTWSLQNSIGIENFINYLSPTIVLSGIIIVILFSRIKPNPRLIKKFAPLAFGVYLLQMNKVVWFYMRDAFIDVASMNTVAGIVCVLGIAGILFLMGLAVEFMRVQFARILKIPDFSKKIVCIIDKVLIRIQVLLK